MLKANKFGADWRLSRQNRFINIGHNVTSIFFNRVLPPPPHKPPTLILFLGAEKFGTREGESNAVYPIKIGW